MQKAKRVGLSPAASQTAGIEIERAVFPVMIWDVCMAEKGDIDLAGEFLFDAFESVGWPTVTVNEADFQSLDLDDFSGWQASSNIGHITIASDRLELTQVAQMLESLKRDQVAQMQNNILPRDPFHKGLREELISG